MSATTTWHLGYLIGIPVLAVLSLAALVGLAFSIRYVIRGTGFGDEWFVLVLTSLATLFILGVTIFAAFPFDTSYHQYYKVGGTIEQVNHRLISSGDGGMSDRYVVVIGGKPYAVDDTRATLLKPGDTVSLWCSKEYQYQGDSGWACEWGAKS